MRSRVLLFVAALALLSATTSTSQTWLSTTSARAWNTYVATVVPDRFSSIIGAGGTRLPNSGNVGGSTFGEYCYTMPMPMSFYFMGQQYAQGAPVMLSTNG